MPPLGLPLDQSLTEWPRAGVIAILDLEYTAWPGSMQRDWSGPSEWRELVQIGCLLADAAHGFAPLDGFEILVKPVRNPELSDYFTALTGITQAALDAAAQPFGHALAALAKFTKPAMVVTFNGNDGEILRENCAMRGVEFPLAGCRMESFRPLLMRGLGNAGDFTSSNLPRLAGIRAEGQAHSALADCKAIAAAFAIWRRQGVI
jgi:inhibitor of KinA sporulation pathway (predicted exonuclease)